MRAACLPVLLCLAGPLVAQDKLTVLTEANTAVAPRKMLYTYLLAEAQKHFDARRQAVAAIDTPEKLRQRQDDLRAKFIAALGGIPEKTPLNARVVGVDRRDGYRVERVVYESRPHHHVTANLYLPDGKGPFPGVLMPIGHSSNGKAADYVQRGSILLAKNGLAVLAYDPIGQGERRQWLDPAGKPGISSSTAEHTLAGVGALLVGRSTASYRVWDGIRSLDYLASRPEIDPTRLGCTGCSGGGTLTSYLMALDDRIACAAPSCYITTLERLFATLGPQDAEQNITGQVAFGLEHADYLTMRAPRPTLICAATRDFFDIRGTWASFREAKLLYGLLGHGERVDLVEFETTHGYPRPQREAVVRWMRRWLLHKDDAPVEGEFPLAKDQELWCTRSGQVLEDLRGKSVFQLNGERADELARARPAHPNRAELLREVRRLIALPDEVRPAKLLSEKKLRRNGRDVRKIVFETEPGILVPALWFVGKNSDGDAPLTMLVHGEGMAAALGPDGYVEKLLAEGSDVLAFDPRGLGETAPGVPSAKPGFFGNDFKETFLALHLNRPLLGQRTQDVLAVVGYLRGPGLLSERELHAVGTGAAVPIVLHAAALESNIREVTLEGGALSWSDVAHTPVTYNQLTNVVPGALKVYDLPELAAMLVFRRLTVRNPVTPSLEMVTEGDLEAAYAVCRRTYGAVGAFLNLRLEVTR